MRDGCGLDPKVHPTLVESRIERFYIVYHEAARADTCAKECSPLQFFVVRPVPSIFQVIICKPNKPFIT